MTLRVGLTHPALAQELKLTWMDYLLTMLRNRLRRKHSYDTKSQRAWQRAVWSGHLNRIRRPEKGLRRGVVRL